jgi:FXSXX-COOH protein
MEQSEEVSLWVLPNLADLSLSQIDDLPSAGLRASVHLLLRRLEDEQEPLYSFNSNI